MDNRQVPPSETDPSFPSEVLGTMESGDAAAKDAEHIDASSNKEDLPKHIQERLGRQEHRHKKELRNLRSEMQQQMQDMHARVGSTNQPSPNATPLNPYNNQPIQPGSHEDVIHRAVTAALAHRDNESKQREQAAGAAHVHEQYQNLQKNLDNASSKYEDFDDVVRDDKKPFTGAMRDASLLLPNAEDVLYKLGKNPDELSRISRLHPLDQAKEMVKLSIALMGAAKSDPMAASRPTMGQIKSNPVNASPRNVSDQTPVSDLRARMKAGSFK